MKAILRKPFPVRPLISCTRLHNQRDFVQQEQTLRLNPLVQVHTTGVPRPPRLPPPHHSIHCQHCPGVLLFLIRKSKSLSPTHLAGNAYIRMKLGLVPCSST